MLKIIKLLRPHWKAAAAVICLLLVQALCELKLPGLMSDIVDIGLVRGGVADADAMYMAQVAAGLADRQVQMHYLWTVGGKMGLISARVGSAIGRDLRRDVFAKVVSFSHTELEHLSTASLITRCTNDIVQVQMTCVLLLRMVLYAPIMGIGGVTKVIAADSGLGWIVAAAVGGLFLLLMVLLLVAMPKFKKMQTLVDNVNLVSREILTGLPVIRAFARERYEEQRFDGANTALRNTQLFTGRTMAAMMPFMNLIMYGISIAIIWFGAHEIQAGTLEIGDMMAFTNYAMQIVMSFMMLSMISIMAPRAIVAADRIYEVLETENVIAEPQQGKVTDGAGEIVFHDVSFRYPGAEDCALEHISFTAKPGETTAIIGSTGCGKTTLLNLLLRFYDVTEGSITLDGVDLRDCDLAALRGRMGYVPQKAVLFSGDIASNIGYSGNVDDDIMKLAADVAQAAEFISEKPEGYGSHIAQGGSNVSGGQKQRLSIARAIASDPDIYLFDDSFSALDYKTDGALRAALKTHAADATVIIVAQRIATVMHAEKIIVLTDGKIDGMGTHEELLRSCKTYREIAVSQLSEKELGLEVDA
ncbi:MAG: ABC transporter ATP-binding protein [Oscillospiraceae bacterium]|nr:ABC transporter ATP-binding protein [Oscillospiraceae bacterium]